MAKQKNQFNLLNGKFNGEDAKEILATLYNDKIQYHRLKSFSHEERFGQPEPHAVERISELKKNLEAILIYLDQNTAKTHFEIHADIVIRQLK
ncbi:MAG: hypothetical protein JST42_19525 [Bacteroidetes bacterium]|nr:hypothetical protein [Bacteroidota bacterium]